MVIFDIPETSRSLRSQLRGFLEKAGFILIQRSVWVTNIDAAKPLSELLANTKADKWVRIFKAREIS